MKEDKEMKKDKERVTIMLGFCSPSRLSSITRTRQLSTVHQGAVETYIKQTITTLTWGHVLRK